MKGYPPYVDKKPLENQNQFGFIPQRSTTNAIMAKKEYVEQNLKDFNYIIMKSLDLKAAFDTAY